MSDLLARAKELAKQGEFDRLVVAQEAADKLYSPEEAVKLIFKAAYDGETTARQIIDGAVYSDTLSILTKKFKNNPEFKGIKISYHVRSLFSPADITFTWKEQS